MKEAIEKSIFIHLTITCKIVINKNAIFQEKQISNAFQQFFH